MGLGDALKDALIGALKNPTNPNNAYREVNRRRKQRQAEARLGTWATQLWLDKMNRGPRAVQYKDEDVVVKVSSGWSRKYRRVTTDVLAMPRDGSGNRLHVILDEAGNELLNEWHD